MFVGVVCFKMGLDYVFIVINMKLRVENVFFWFSLVLEILVVDGILMDLGEV